MTGTCKPHSWRHEKHLTLCQMSTRNQDPVKIGQIFDPIFDPPPPPAFSSLLQFDFVVLMKVFLLPFSLSALCKIDPLEGTIGFSPELTLHQGNNRISIDILPRISIENSGSTLHDKNTVPHGVNSS